MPAPPDGEVTDDDRRGFVGVVDGKFMHYCHCGKWAPFGVGYFPRKNVDGKWYCAEHLPPRKYHAERR